MSKDYITQVEIFSCNLHSEEGILDLQNEINRFLIEVIPGAEVKSITPIKDVGIILAYVIKV